jgi:hypothetical protein
MCGKERRDRGKECPLLHDAKCVMTDAVGLSDITRCDILLHDAKCVLTASAMPDAITRMQVWYATIHFCDQCNADHDSTILMIPLTMLLRTNAVYFAMLI